MKPRLGGAALGSALSVLPQPPSAVGEHTLLFWICQHHHVRRCWRRCLASLQQPIASLPLLEGGPVLRRASLVTLPRPRPGDSEESPLWDVAFERGQHWFSFARLDDCRLQSAAGQRRARFRGHIVLPRGDGPPAVPKCGDRPLAKTGDFIRDERHRAAPLQLQPGAQNELAASRITSSTRSG